MSAVLGFAYARWRRQPGGPAKGQHTLRHVLKGLHRASPPHRRARRLPVLQHHLRALRHLPDLRNSQFHRVLRAFYLKCWQGVCRSGDLIREKHGGTKAWSPTRDTHRGRHRFELFTGAYGAHRVRLCLLMKPSKTDPTGEQAFERTFVVDSAPNALSAGYAILQMLKGDPSAEGADLGAVPLFRDSRTGRELTYNPARVELRLLLTQAGYPELARGLHSLRIGGATMAAAIGGEYTAARMGLWRSESRREYIWASQTQIEAVAAAMGRSTGEALAIRPGPLSTFT